MWIALYRMKTIIKSMPRLSKNLNMRRMIYHGLGYTLFVITFVSFTFAYFLGKLTKLNLYACWFIMAFATLITYIFLFLNLLHLGSKEEPVDAAVRDTF